MKTFKVLLMLLMVNATMVIIANAANLPEKQRIFILTDIGGTDPDDFQSMVHLLMYADVFDIEGLISSPFGPGRQYDILRVINAYEKDYPSLIKHSKDYPKASALRKIAKQGETEIAGYKGFGSPTEGSEWIVKCAKRDDPRPLYILVWGGIEDLAQALHDAPEILTKLRVYYIGGPNKKWGPNAYQYIVDYHPELWIIESNATYRGWFTGGNQSGEFSNTAFPDKYIKGKGAMAEFFMAQLGGKIKMGDTPSLVWLLKGNADDPTQPGWGGQYVRAWDRPYYLSSEMPQKSDSMQEFGILEIALPITGNVTNRAEAFLNVTNQKISGFFKDDGTVRFRFSPKSEGTFTFEIESNIAELNGKNGAITSFIPPPELASRPSDKFPNWYTDNPSPEWMEGSHIGAKTVSQWREEYLMDWAGRLELLE